MTHDLQIEYAKLSESARAVLESAPESSSYRRVFSYWEFPSFTLASRWTLYAPLPFAKGKSVFAEEVIWRSDLDLTKFSSPLERLKYPKEVAPTIESLVVGLSPEDLSSIEKRLSGICIPLYLEEPSFVGCDGSEFKFEFQRSMFGVSLRWWESYPDEWRPWTLAISSIIEEFRKRKGAEPAATDNAI